MNTRDFQDELFRLTLSEKAGSDVVRIFVSRSVDSGLSFDNSKDNLELIYLCLCSDKYLDSLDVLLPMAPASARSGLAERLFSHAGFYSMLETLRRLREFFPSYNLGSVLERVACNSEPSTQIEVAELLVREGADVRWDNGAAVRRALRCDSREMLIFFMRHGINREQLLNAIALEKAGGGIGKSRDFSQTARWVLEEVEKGASLALFP